MCDIARQANPEDHSVRVSLGPRSYEISIVNRRLNHVAEAVENWMVRAGYPRGQRTALIVTDRNIAHTLSFAVSHSLTEADINCRTFGIEPGEPSKSLATVSDIYDELVEMHADRNTCILAVGGGVVGDLAGFVASTYNRGLPFVQVPTTLLAQVDSSVGGKVGVNHPKGKNLIGAFYQPLGVYIDMSVLLSLPDRDYRSGLAEVVKYGVILDPVFFEYLEHNIDALNRRDPVALQHVVARSCRLKADIVEQDEFERTGVRACLNYGHTFAHAFEALCGYGSLTHGEAVAIGMMHASRLAERQGLIDGSLTERQFKLLTGLGLPTELPKGECLDPNAVLECMQLDKKTVGGQLRFVLPTRMGHVEVFKDVPEESVRAVLEKQ
ncbi:MAG TPA: 3-dehydroquinate synthase [Planctomycetaceae bacterium]|nr:3-dehydroquinate synthase [Planctomycetaceae bacterium]